jgi:hypothetical protein
MENWILIVHHKTDKDVTKMGAKFLVSNDQGLSHLKLQTLNKGRLIVHHKTDKDVTKMGAKFFVSKDQGLCHTLNSKPWNKGGLIVCIYSC